MKIRVLGCHGGSLHGFRTTAFLLDGKLTIDGGSICDALTLDEIYKIDDVFLSHAHFDHIKDVPLMTDLLVGKRQKPLIVHGPAETMEAMDKDIFNNRVWPDFRTIPTREKPVIAFDTIPVYEPVLCQGLRIRAVPVRHPVYSVGYIIEGRNGAIAFSGDTGPTEELWKAINATPNVKAVFVELSFPSSMQLLVDGSVQLTA